MRASHVGAVVGAWLALSSCSNAGDPPGAVGNASSGGAGTSGSGGSGGDAGSGGAGTSGAGTSGAVGDAILTVESEAIEIHWFSFFSGGYRFERRVDQLSTAQHDLAEAIRIVADSGECWSDAVEMALTVTDFGTPREFAANSYTGTCQRDRTLVEYDAVTALLATVDCLSAQGYDGQSLETAPSIIPDDGCWHGLFNSSGSVPSWWFRAEIPAAGEYRIAIDGCYDRELGLDLLESDAMTTLASVAGDGTCPVLTHTFASAGSYVLRVQMTSGSSAGDFFLGLESMPP